MYKNVGIRLCYKKSLYPTAGYGVCALMRVVERITESRLYY